MNKQQFTIGQTYSIFNFDLTTNDQQFICVKRTPRIVYLDNGFGVFPHKIKKTKIGTEIVKFQNGSMIFAN